jgi:NAD(P)-dependent dehydrogenase (short-subunit alcohol dehydrogenase family)
MELLPSLRLSGRTAAVTGAANGIGREIARVLAAAGAFVVVIDVDVDNADAVAADIRSEGGASAFRIADVASAVQVKQLASDIINDHAVIDIIVNNAGVVTLSPFLSLSARDLDAVLAVNLRGTYLMTRAFVPAMLQAGFGRIINVSSMLAKTPVRYTAHYAAAKAGVIAFTQAVAKEAAPAVTVNCLCPTSIETRMADVDYEFYRTHEGISPAELKQRWIDAVPLRRLGTPMDVAWAALLLAGETGSFTTGQAINVSGGQELH